MSDERYLTSAESELESALRGLRPAGASIERDQFMFRAGQASATRRGRLWQGATAALAIALAASFLVRPSPKEVERIVYVPQQPPSSTDRRPANVEPFNSRGSLTPFDGSYLRLRNAVLAHGLDALSAFGPPAGPFSTSSRSPDESAPDTTRQAPDWRIRPGNRLPTDIGEQL